MTTTRTTAIRTRPTLRALALALLTAALVAALAGCMITPVPTPPPGGGPLAAPTQLSPVSGAVFNHYPRTLTLAWQAVPRATSYTVEVDYCSNAGCNASASNWFVQTNIAGTTYTFDFVGAQPGRWRVRAVSSSGQPGPQSAWSVFRFTQ